MIKPRDGGRRRAPAKRGVVAIDVQSKEAAVPHDENLLERAHTQWQFGDWENLVRLDRDTLQHHPDRAKLALLAAAGRMQIGDTADAMQFVRFALDWGINKIILARVLTAGVHNSLGRAAMLSEQSSRAFKHFEAAILIGAPGADTRLLTQARIAQQLQQISPEASFPEQAVEHRKLSAGPSSTIKYLINVNLRFDGSSNLKLGMNANNPTWLRVQQDIVEYDTDNDAPLYLVSNEDGDFNKSPCNVQIPIVAGTAYRLSGQIAHNGDKSPVIWIFQFCQDKKIDAQSVNVVGGHFHHSFKTLPTTDSLAVGIRVGGKGRITPGKTTFVLKEHNGEDIIAHLEEKIEKMERLQKRDLENSVRQIEACVRLQHYLGSDIILPNMHNWPISPDFGVFLINLVEQNSYDGVIEFGSGTSTLILAKAMKQVDQRDGRIQSPLLSFDHLQEYAEGTQRLIKRAGLMEYANISLAPLVPWHDDNGNQYSYYACGEALRAYQLGLPETASRLLVIIDGPPATTGKHARYPALVSILDAFPGKYVIHFLLDDYLRTDEQEIVAHWLNILSARQLPYTRTVLDNLEKKACLIEVRPAEGRGNE